MLHNPGEHTTVTTISQSSACRFLIEPNNISFEVLRIVSRSKGKVEGLEKAIHSSSYKKDADSP